MDVCMCGHHGMARVAAQHAAMHIAHCTLHVAYWRRKRTPHTDALPCVARRCVRRAASSRCMEPSRQSGMGLPQTASMRSAGSESELELPVQEMITSVPERRLRGGEAGARVEGGAGTGWQARPRGGAERRGGEAARTQWCAWVEAARRRHGGACVRAAVAAAAAAHVRSSRIAAEPRRAGAGA
eukprot:1771723-Prymnesium_polylepis.1